MKASEIKEMTNEELVDHLSEQQEKLTSLRLTNAVSPVENPAQFKDIKKAIARIKTEQRNRQTEA